MQIVRRNKTYRKGEAIAGVWFSPRLDTRGFEQRWANPSLYSHVKRILVIRRSVCHVEAEKQVDYILNGGLKRKFRGVAYNKRGIKFLPR